MPRQHSRRSFLQAVAAAALTRLCPSAAQAQAALPAFSYPMGLPGQPLGDGLFVRIAYAAENARYYPGWWHTGENWHLLEGGTAGLPVYAAAAGEVVFAGYDYPGPVVIVQHAADLFSMYGHLDYAVAVEVGQRVTRGEQLGTVLARGDDVARSHLHFELRTFFTKPEINGDNPQYGVHCGYECPPGPGYWPMSAPEHPSQMGWLNPTHVINRRAWPDGTPDGTQVQVSTAAPASTPLWTAPPDGAGAASAGELSLTPGDRYPLQVIDVGAEDDTGTSAEATRLWYQIALSDGSNGWVQAAVPVAIDSGSDGRPSSLRFDFLPMVLTAGA
jgi:murein DD-endopeptidase MepM/ murein hydrolase activator NlpD